jgi:hypothetical protein
VKTSPNFVGNQFVSVAWTKKESGPIDNPREKPKTQGTSNRAAFVLRRAEAMIETESVNFFSCDFFDVLAGHRAVITKNPARFAANHDFSPSPGRDDDYLRRDRNSD